MMPTFDAVRLVALSESSPRTSQIDTLQYHHAATTSLAALENLMEAGGRTVSANCALATDGELILKVPVNRRAFTSGVASYDQRCITVETVNTSGAPEWGISDASHRRLGRLAAEMFREGLLRGLWYGTGGIIGHRDVPGTYATACPGPSFSSDLILKYANEFLNLSTKKEEDMEYEYIWTTGPTRYALLHPTNLDGGFEETTDVRVAEGWNSARNLKGGREVKSVDWAKTLNAARSLFEQAKAQRPTGGPAGDPTPIVKAIEAMSKTLGDKITALPAEIDRYADGKKQS